MIMIVGSIVMEIFASGIVIAPYLKADADACEDSVVEKGLVSYGNVLHDGSLGLGDEALIKSLPPFRPALDLVTFARQRLADLECALQCAGELDGLSGQIGHYRSLISRLEAASSESSVSASGVA